MWANTLNMIYIDQTIREQLLLDQEIKGILTWHVNFVLNFSVLISFTLKSVTDR